jgi:hypothetical protein
MVDQMNRRRVFGLGAAAATVGFGTAAGTTLGSTFTAAAAQHADDFAVRAVCANPATLATHTALGAARFVDEGSGNAADITIDEAFFQQLYNWRNWWQANCTWPWTTELWNHGAYSRRDGSCTSWHEAGRAIDITALKDDVTTIHFWGRYDIWKNLSNAAAHRRRYWAGAASLHHHFRSVLTYFYNSEHHDHIHVDNGENGSALTTFASGSKAQVQGVQGICANVWGYPCGTDGVWNTAVSAAASKVLQRAGRPGGLTDSVGHWRTFLYASTRQGTGKQAY